MTNRTIEAVLRLSAKLGPMGAFGQMAAKLNQVNQKAVAFNRTQAAMARAGNAVNGVMAASAMRYLGPAALAAGAIASTKQYAAYERQLTRTGLKIGATRKEMADLGQEAYAVAQRYAVANDAVVQTIDAYAETGATLKDVRADLDGIVKAQQAMGAEGADVVNTWDTARKNFGLMSRESERFFDMMAYGGNMGKFEGSDMARYLPELMPRAGRLGMSGLSGTASLVGALEVMRDQTGNSEKAATALSDFLDKISSPTVERNFKKLNVDLPKALKEGRKNGEPLFVTMAKAIDKATGGNENLLGHLFSEKDSRDFAGMLIKSLDRLMGTIDEIRDKSKGTIQFNIKAVTDDAESAIQHLSNSWDKFVNSTGRGIVAAGGANALDRVSDSYDYNSAINEQLTKQGYNWLEQRLWHAFYDSNPDARDRLARKGGYLPPEERHEIETHKAYGDSRRAALAGQGTTYDGVAVDANGVPYPILSDGSNAPPLPPYTTSHPYPAQHGRGSSFRPGTVDEGIARPPGTGFRGEPPAPGLIDVIDDSGRQVGQSISEGIAQGGQKAGNEFQKMIEGMGKLIGADAAAAFNAGVKPIPVAPPPAGVRADTGKSVAGQYHGPK